MHDFANTELPTAHLNHSPLLRKVGVLMGGKSQERAISLMTGQGVLDALKAKGVNAYAFDPGTQSINELAAQDFSSCFIALHGRYGEDGVMQSMLEYLNIPYTGSGVLASSVAMNKVFTKRIWQTHGIPTPKFLAFNHQDTPELTATALDAIATELGFPCIVKPGREGSSIGLSKVSDVAGLQQAYQQAAQLDELILIEQFIQGRELTCAILVRPQHSKRPQALPLIEINAPDANYDYQNKYFSDDVRYTCPAPISEALATHLQKIAVEAFEALGCNTWARVDIMLNADEQLFLLEINTSPGMTSHSLVPMAARAIGLDYEALVLEVLLQAKLNKLG